MNPDFDRPWASGLRALVLKKLREHGPQTAHELATACGVGVEALRPRLTELHQAGEIVPGARRPGTNGRGRRQAVWQIILESGTAESTEPVMRLL